jgi:Tfp pilus assembly protein PilZ
MNLTPPDGLRAASAALPTRVTDLIKVHVSAKSDSHFFAGRGGDVTKGGIFIATHRVMAIGDALLVELRIEDALVAAPGIVVWRTSGGRDTLPGVGVALRELTESNLRVIEKFCARRPPFYFDLSDRGSVSDEGDLRAFAPKM